LDLSQSSTAKLYGAQQMAIQDIIKDVRARVETASKQYQDAFFATVEVNKKALNVVSNNARSLAKTEVGAAKNLFAAAQASFDKARKDGVRQIANKPSDYVPNGRDQVVAAYKQTIELLVKTGNELSDVVTKGYKTVIGKLNGKKAAPKKAPAKKAAAKKTAAKKPAARKTAAKRTTSATSKAGNGTATAS